MNKYLIFVWIIGLSERLEVECLVLSCSSSFPLPFLLLYLLYLWLRYVLLSETCADAVGQALHSGMALPFLFNWATANTDPNAPPPQPTMTREEMRQWMNVLLRSDTDRMKEYSSYLVSCISIPEEYLPVISISLCRSFSLPSLSVHMNCL